MSQSTRGERPFLLSFVTVLLIISGIVSIAFGVLFIVESDNATIEEKIGSGSATALGIAVLIGGIVTIAVALALRHGSRTARMIIAVVEVLDIVASGYTLTQIDSAHIGAAIGNIIAAAFVLWYLFFHRDARRFFGDA